MLTIISWKLFSWLLTQTPLIQYALRRGCHTITQLKSTDSRVTSFTKAVEFITIFLVIFVLKHRDDGPTHNVIEVWKKNFNGQGVVVAVVDEGFNPNHPEIKDNYVCLYTRGHLHLIFLTNLNCSLKVKKYVKEKSALNFGNGFFFLRLFINLPICLGLTFACKCRNESLS